MTVKSTTSELQTKGFVEDKISQAKRKEFMSFLICTKTDEIIAYVFLKNIDWNIPKSEMGFFIDKAFEGKGIISKAVAEIVKHSFSVLGINKLFMRIEEENKASLKVAERNGFLLEGKLHSDFKSSNGELLDVLYYGKVSGQKK
jgi:ribosomal-protein-serine acetyltransferase